MVSIDNVGAERPSPLPKKKPVLYVEAGSRHLFPSLSEMWQFREMLYFLTIRDFKLRYKQTVLGVLWAVIQPFTTMVIFSIFFGGVAKISSDGFPYPLFSFAALVPWTFFSNGVSASADSLVGQAHMVKKIYFPRIFIPLSRVVGGVIDLVLSLVILIFMMLAYQKVPTLASLVVIPLLSLLTVMLTLAVSLWFSALNVRYRDVRYVVPFLIQIWLFATPIAYSSSLLSDTARAIYGLNPMVTIVEGYRAALLGDAPVSSTTVLLSCLTTTLLLISGIWFFHRAEGTFSDVV